MCVFGEDYKEFVDFEEKNTRLYSTLSDTLDDVQNRKLADVKLKEETIRLNELREEEIHVRENVEKIDAFVGIFANIFFIFFLCIHENLLQH